jgi:hypothetical protein
MCVEAFWGTGSFPLKVSTVDLKYWCCGTEVPSRDTVLIFLLAGTLRPFLQCVAVGHVQVSLL